MNFQDLLARMSELDKPVAETPVIEEPAVTDECGDMPPAPMGMPKPDAPPPSMSVNLNAQGLDNIEELLALIKAVKGDEKPMPPMPMPTIMKLPDFDADNDEKVGGEMDMDREKEEALANSPEGSPDEPEIKGLDAAVPDGDDLNKPKSMYKRSQPGDNAMAAEDLRASIREELLRRLEEAKTK